MKKITAESFRQYRIPQQVKLSPDASKVAVSLQTVNNEEDSYFYHIYVKKDQEFQQVTGLGKEGNFIWDDNDTLLFVSMREESDQKKASEEEFTVFYRLSLLGGEAQKAFTVPVRVTSFEKVGQGKYLMGAYCDATVPDYYKMSTEQKQQVAQERKKNKDFTVIDETPFWHNGMPGFTNKMRNRLFYYEEETDTITPCSNPLFDVRGHVVIGDSVYYCGVEYSQTDPIPNDVMAFDMDHKQIRMVFKNEQFYCRGQFISAFDDQLVFMADVDTQYGANTHPNYYLMDKQTGSLTLMYPGDHSFYTVMSKGNHFLYNSYQRYSCLLFKGDERGVTPAFDWDGSIRSFDEQEGKIVFTGSHGTLLNEVYEVMDGKVERISHFNDAFLSDVYVGACEPLTITSHSWEVDGYVIKPIDFDSSKTYPAILTIHGGPKGAYYPEFDHAMQQWASAGYFVFFCNPIGSDGRGNAFAEIRKLHGTVDYEDVMNFTDAVLEKYPQIDPNRLGVTGISYGGYMTNWIIGHTKRFQAAVSQCSVVNWISMVYVSDISRTYVKDQMGGSLYDSIDMYWDRSPLKYACNATTPTLFIQPLADFRCHLSDGLQMITALMDHGCETRVVCFEGDHHGLNYAGKPSHRERSFVETMQWMDSHLQSK